MEKDNTIPTDATRVIVFETKPHSFTVTKREALKITEKTLLLVEPASRWRTEHTRLADLHSNWGDFWLTRTEANNHLFDRAEAALKKAELQIKTYREVLKKLSTKPE